MWSLDHFCTGCFFKSPLIVLALPENENHLFSLRLLIAPSTLLQCKLGGFGVLRLQHGVAHGFRRKIMHICCPSCTDKSCTTLLLFDNISVSAQVATKATDPLNAPGSQCNNNAPCFVLSVQHPGPLLNLLILFSYLNAPCLIQWGDNKP